MGPPLLRLNTTEPEGAFHSGVDIGSNFGAKIIAPADGVVTITETMGGYGKAIIIDHGNGYFSLMAHLATLARAKDDVVRAGEVVGTVGDTGSLKGAYLYFELRSGQTALDPERWLAAPRRKGSSPAVSLSRKP